MNLSDWIPFWPDDRTYFVPWLKFHTQDGSQADGPMIRQGQGRREVLVWTEAGRAEAAARELVAQTGGKFEVRTMDRKAVTAACRVYASWGSPVVAVIMK